jgi:hypothetical protein
LLDPSILEKKNLSASGNSQDIVFTVAFKIQDKSRIESPKADAFNSLLGQAADPAAGSHEDIPLAVRNNGMDKIEGTV